MISEALQKAILHDREVIRAAGVRPLAIVRRLTEMAAGVDGSCHWRMFKMPGQGESSQSNDSGELKVVLEFRNSDDGAAVCVALHALREQFQAISAIRTSALRKRGLSVILVVTEPA